MCRKCKGKRSGSGAHPRYGHGSACPGMRGKIGGMNGRVDTTGSVDLYGYMQGMRW